MDTDAVPEQAEEPHDQQQLLVAVYAELKARARRIRRGHADGTLNTTALVHESFLKIMESNPRIRDREHLHRLAALAMRQLLIDKVRERQAEKRGGDLQRVDLDDLDIAEVDSEAEWTQVQQAMERLDKLSPRMADVFLLRAFGDLGYEEIADLLECSKSSAHRDFEAARAFLLTSLRSAPDAGTGTAAVHHQSPDCAR